MTMLTIGQRICTFFDGDPRYGRLVRFRKNAIVCTFEDDGHAIEYAMRPGDVYAIAEGTAAGLTQATTSSKARIPPEK